MQLSNFAGNLKTSPRRFNICWMLTTMFNKREEQIPKKVKQNAKSVNVIGLFVTF